MSPSAWRSLLAISASLFAFSSLQVAQAAQVRVEVVNVPSPKGHIRISVCTRDTFLHHSCAFEATAPAAVGETTVVLPDVPPGTYAAQVFQDEQDDGIVHRNFVGVPTEGIGFSNDAPLHLKGPTFKEAAFQVGQQTVELRVRLRNLLH